MKITSLLLIPGLFFMACKGSDQCSGKQVTCPAFTDSVSLAWVPYLQGQSVYFSNGVQTDSFVVDSRVLSTSQQTTVSGQRPYCDATANWQLVSWDGKTVIYPFTIAIQQSKDQFTPAENDFVSINFEGSQFLGNRFSDTGLVPLINSSTNQVFHSQFYHSLPLNNRIFTDIQVIILDTTALLPDTPARAYKIWLSKHIGLVAYEQYPGGSRWIKQ